MCSNIADGNGGGDGITRGGKLLIRLAPISSGEGQKVDDRQEERYFTGGTGFAIKRSPWPNPLNTIFIIYQ